jgi:hypothetical protein
MRLHGLAEIHIDILVAVILHDAVNISGIESFREILRHPLQRESIRVA